jgi:4-carboxymuconolactone decarboxylase
MAERLAARVPGELDPAQRSVYDAITGGKRSQGPTLFEITGDHGELLGPFAAMVANPVVGGPLQRLGEALRYETSLPGNVRELVILCVAAEFRSEFEWYAHEAVARQLGFADDVLRHVRSGTRPPGLDDEQQTAWSLTRALLRRQPIDDAMFASARSSLGEGGVVEVVSLVGYYSLLAQLLEVFELGLPDGVTPTFDR